MNDIYERLTGQYPLRLGDRQDAAAEIARLRAELTEARKPDCRSCRYYFEIEEDCFLLRKNERCINASEYKVQGGPLRLYEKEGQ